MMITDDIIKFTHTLFPHQNCVGEALFWLAGITQAVLDLDHPDSDIRKNAEWYLTSDLIKHDCALINCDYDQMKHCFNLPYMRLWVKNLRRREKYATRSKES